MVLETGPVPGCDYATYSVSVCGGSIEKATRDVSRSNGSCGYDGSPVVEKDLRVDE